MGNCQPIPSSLEDAEEDFSVAATANSLFACSEMHMAMSSRPKKSATKGKSGSSLSRKSKCSGGDVRKTFLKLHRPDLAQRSIVEPDEVDKVLMHQADELLHRRGLLDRIGSNHVRKQDVRDDNPKLEIMSHTGGASVLSGFTTASHSTVVAGNAKTSKSKKSRGGNALPGALNTVSESDYEADHEYEKTPPRNKLHLQRNASTSLHLAGTQTSPKQLEIDAKRNRYMSVLRLKMKARLGPFYSQRYLPMFPKSPRPVGVSIPKNRSDVPDLASESSTERSLGLIPRRGSVSPDQSMTQQSTSFMTSSSNLKSPDHYIVLINRRSGIPLAVCAMKAGSGPPVVRIYATRKRVYGQRPAATTTQLGLEWAQDLPLFTWAEMVTVGKFPEQMKFSIFMANGSEGRFSTHPSYEANFDGNLEEPVIKMIGQTDMERASSGCALVCIRADEDSSHKDVAGMSFHIDLARGIDPALMICFTAIADEVIEKSMRDQCKEHVQHRIRKATHSLAKKRMMGSHRGG
ncbi:MAG: hypothetical protein SGARI_001924 [Bacillariaceae sp.]